jgi:FkbM family methyltransferase
MNLRQIKKTFGYFLNKEKKIYHESNFLGIKIKTLKGTLRKSQDMDDAWLFHLTKHSEIFYDLGANIGYISLMAAVQKNNRFVVSVDPNPEALAKSAQNLIINGFGYKSRFISAFISDKDNHKIKFYTVGSGQSGSMYASHAETASAINSHYFVNQLTIDTLVNQTQLIPDLIKIDVEGAESLALKGAIETAKKQVAKFIIEMHSLPELTMKDNSEFVIEWCKNNSYIAYYLKDKIVLNDANLIANRGKCHLLLIPKNQDFPNYLSKVNQRDEIPNVL